MVRVIKSITLSLKSMPVLERVQGFLGALLFSAFSCTMERTLHLGKH